MNIGGKNAPTALIAHITVTVAPLSPLVTLPTVLCPLVAMIFPGRCTLVIPVSSMFEILDGVHGTSASSCLYTAKNCSTLGLLKATARDRFVPCGTRIARSGYLEKNPESQSFPAISLFSQN